MSTKIIDKLAPPQKSPSKIHLVACLQNNKNREGNSYFYEHSYHSLGFKEIARVGQITHIGTEYDVIIADNSLFLGHWNDGVL